MKYDAVIFDLFGTLVDELTHPPSHAECYYAMVGDVIEMLHVDHARFMSIWHSSAAARATGELGTVEDALSFICDEIGEPRSADQIAPAAAVRLEFYRHGLIPRADSLETIERLKQMGLRVGLISDCSEEVSRLWHTTPLSTALDTVVLSCEVGMRKPQAEIYALACNRLGVEPDRCLYVGDGNSTELAGASNLGMEAVLIRAPNDTDNGEREDWDGTRIAFASEVLDLVQ